MSETETAEAPDGIAIIGMAGRFPGANNIDELWQNLCAGVESISFFSDEELREAGVDPELLELPNYVRARGALGDAEYFDAAFFGHSPHVAALMDPQHRLFLECAWTALEHAGYDAERSNGRIGVFGGESMNTYLLNNVFSHMRMVASVDSLQASIGNDKDSLTTEVAYKLNLTGPSLTIQTASSTSLVAVHIACQSLLNYECDMGLAGGVSIHFPEKAGYLYQEGGATSPDGHCRAFDAGSNGFVNGHGAGVVVLKRLENALEDNDTIYAVIRGSAVNNDGAVKVSYMAPSVDGQAAVIAMAQAVAGVEPATISYVEAHGTGTNLGDPIEIAALTQAFRAGTQKRNYCAIGSIKTNIGHLDTAAGVAGLIKTALALTYRRIPASLHFEQPNAQIDFASSPFFVNNRLTEWRSNGTPRRAGVSSFGMGGTNAHAVVEEAPTRAPTDAARSWQLLTLSAKSSSALDRQTAELAAHLQQHTDLNLADVAYTLHVGRRDFNYRRTLVCRDQSDAAHALASSDPERLFSSYHEPGERPVVFMFSGQGAQYTGMAADVYRDEVMFRQALDQCALLLQPLMGVDIRSIIFATPGAPDAGHEQQAALLEQTQYAQPALFAVEYALAQLWISWGVRPSAMIGHSVGEYVAACLAGVFSLADALALIAARGRMMQAMPPGAMLAVPLPEAELRPLLGAQLALAAVNGPALCVVSGPAGSIEQLALQLLARGLSCRRLHTSHAFHSSMMDPLLAPFAELVRGTTMHAPQIPFISNVSGTWINIEQATEPSYWAAHLRQTVRFADGLGELLRDPQTVLLELGPGQTLTTLARQHPAKTIGHTVLSSLRHPQDTQPDRAFLLGTLAKLWLAGVDIDAEHLYAGEARRRIALPTYPFERQRFWLEPLKLAAAAPAQPAALHKRADLADWFYLPFWKPTLAPAAPASGAAPIRWLVFADQLGLSAELARHLQHGGHEIVVVRAGAAFERLDYRLYAIDPGERQHYDLLLADLDQLALMPDRIVHAWSISSTPSNQSTTAAAFAAAQQRGFLSLLSLTQALGAQPAPQALHIVALSSAMQCVAAEQAVSPEKATLLGLCKVIPQEYPHLTCQSVDVALPGAGERHTTKLAGMLAAECLRPSPGGVLAYRDGRRWEQAFEPVRLEPGSSPIRAGGVYMITGGFGGIGLSLARHLAGTAQAKLALVARTALPPRDEWDSRLASHDDELSRRIRSVQELEALGADVLALAADVTQTAELRAAIEQIDTHYGALHGVIHAAGLVHKSFFQAVQETDQQACEQHFQAKAYGPIVLEQALADRQLDFCMLVSSLSSVLGGLGFGAYAAANCFMDAFAQQHNQHSSSPWLSVNWDAWQLTDAQRHGLSVREQSAAFAITPQEGIDAFERIVGAGPVPQIVVSTADLGVRIIRWIELEQLHKQGPAEPAEASSFHPRPQLPNPYIAPRNETEQAIAELWQTTLGVQQVGIHDNFFDLGGNSLSGITLIGQLKERFGVHIPTVSLYEGPTVSAFAKLIEQDEAEQPTYEHSRSRAERRREKRRGRQGDRNRQTAGDEVAGNRFTQEG